MFPQSSGSEWASLGSPWSSCSRRRAEAKRTHSSQSTASFCPPPHTQPTYLSQLSNRDMTIMSVLLMLYHCIIRLPHFTNRTSRHQAPSDWPPSISSGFLTVWNFRLTVLQSSPFFNLSHLHCSHLLQRYNTVSNTSCHQVWDWTWGNGLNTH